VLALGFTPLPRLAGGLKRFLKRTLFRPLSAPAALLDLSPEEREIIYDKLKTDLDSFGKQYGFPGKKWEL
jgi:hypothetical protein